MVFEAWFYVCETKQSYCWLWTRGLDLMISVQLIYAPYASSIPISLHSYLTYPNAAWIYPEAALISSTGLINSDAYYVVKKKNIHRGWSSWDSRRWERLCHYRCISLYLDRSIVHEFLVIQGLRPRWPTPLRDNTSRGWYMDSGARDSNLKTRARRRITFISVRTFELHKLLPFESL